jgi:hypothetical protein
MLGLRGQLHLVGALGTATSRTAVQKQQQQQHATASTQRRRLAATASQQAAVIAEASAAVTLSATAAAAVAVQQPATLRMQPYGQTTIVFQVRTRDVMTHR